MTASLRTVLVFAHECAPYHRPQSTVGAQRPAQFAKHLPEFGWRAVVICCRHGERRRGTLDGLAEQVRSTLRAADPRRSLVIPTPSLPWDGWLDRLWHATVPANGTAGLWRVLVRKPLTAAKFLTGDYSQSWQPCAALAARVVAEETPVDACIGEHSPDAGLFLARWFARHHGVPWLADFRDPILQPLRPLGRRLYAPVARRLLATAAGTVNVNPVWTEFDRRLFGLPAWTIPNGFDPDEYRGPRGERNERFTVAYLGRVDQVQRPEIFLEGLALARRRLGPQAEDRLRFFYRGYAAERIARLAADQGVRDLVDTGGHIDRGQALAELCRADALLLLSVTEPGRQDEYFTQGFYPAKVFECFGARRPILCVPGDKGILDRLVRETQTGVVVDTPEKVAAFLEDAWRRWDRGEALPYSPDEERVSSYSRRNLAARLADVLDGLARPAVDTVSATSDRVACPSEVPP